MTVSSFAKFIDTVPGALMVVSRDGQIRLLNQNAAELFGYSKEELTDHGVELLIPEPLRLRHGAHVRAFFSEGARKRRLGPELELSAARKDGGQFFVEIGLNPISLDGEPMVAAAIRDISERRRDLEALRLSEARQRLVLETSPDPILIVDREGTIEFASRTLDGQDPKVLVGRKMSQFVRASDLSSLASLLSTASPERPVWTLQSELVDLSGTTRQVNFRVRPLDASPTGRLLVVVVDITVAHGSALELFRLQQAMEHAVEGIARVDARGKILSANQSYEAALGAELGALIGTDWRGCVPADCHPQLNEALALAEEAGRSVLECTGVRADGSSVRLSLTMVQVRDARGSPAGHYTFLQDVSERHTEREQLLVSDRMASVGMLAAGVAHEINNPLAAVLLNLELAVPELAHLLPAGPSDLKEAVTEARDSALRVRQIVRDLRIFARHEDEAMGPVDVERVLESTLRMGLNEIRHRARLVKRFSGIPLVEANEARLGQVFLNLVINAAQAIREGSADTNELRVTTRVDAEGQVVVEISDTGCGIAPEVLPRLFTPLFTTKPPGVGTGLGLTICRRLVGAMGGTIRIESQLGKGTTAFVTLPPAKSQQIEPPPPSAPTPSARRGRVLVVDDEPMICKAMIRTLSSEHSVVAVNTGGQALALISAGERFDVILCDLMMPQVTGMDLHAQLQAVAPEQAGRMVFVTGGAFTPAARAFLEAVPNARLEKPVDSQRLRSVINHRIPSA